MSLYSVVTTGNLSPDAKLLCKKRVSSANQHCPYSLSSEVIINDKGGNASEPTRLMKQLKHMQAYDTDNILTVLCQQHGIASAKF